MTVKTAATSYEVRWRKNSDPVNLWSSPANVGADGHISVPGLERVTDYTFEARAVSACGAKSAWATQLFNLPKPPPPPPPRVPDVSGVADGIALNWGGDAAPAASTMFELQRAAATGSYTVAPPPEGDASWSRVAIISGTAWTDNVSSTAAYWYRIRTIDFAGNTGAWVVLGSPKSASISTNELSAQTQASFGQLQNDFDATTAQVQVLQGQVGDILQADVWSSTTTYPKGDLVQQTGQLFRSLIDGNLNHQPVASTTDANWEYIGNYSSLGEAVGANAAGLATLENTVTSQGNTLTAQSQSISANTAAIGTKASATDLQSTQATVTQQGKDISANTTAISSLLTTANGLQTQVTNEQTARVDGDQANASNITAVTARVGTLEDAGHGVNILPDPLFSQGLTQWSNGFEQTHVDWTLAIGSGAYQPPGVPCVWAQPSGTPSGWWTYISSALARDVVPGARYIASCYMVAQRTQGGAHLLFFDKSGNVVGYDATAPLIESTPADFGVPGAYSRSSVSQTAPVGAVTAMFAFACAGASSGDPYALFFWPMIEEATGTQSSPSPFTNSPQSAVLAASVATQAKATADAVTGKVNASYTLRVEANGYVSGYTFQNDGSQANFNVQADNFNMTPASGTGAGVYLNPQGFSMFDGSNAFMGGPGFGSDADKLLLYRGTNATQNAASIANANFAITSGGKLKLGGAWSNFTAGWSSGASISYTASAGSPASATISVTAGTFMTSGSPINYNASSVTISGTGGTTAVYYLYYTDAAMTGGAKALGASTNSSVAFDDPNKVFIDKVSITFPSSGSGGGPIGGGGACVCADMWLRPGLTARDLARRWRWWKPWLWLLKGQDGWHFVRRRPRVVQEPCVHVTVADGAWIECSTSTPVTTQPGESVLAPMLLGHLMYTDSGWQRVIDVDPLDGPRDVVRICVGGHSFFAGADPYRRISTHNIFKP